MSRIKLASLVGLAALTLAWAPVAARADDTHTKVTPAVLQLNSDNANGATVQQVRWGVGFGGGGWGGGWSGQNGGFYFGNPGYYGGYGGYYGGGYYPYYGGYYGYPSYYSYPYYGGGYYSPYYYYSW